MHVFRSTFARGLAVVLAVILIMAIGFTAVNSGIGNALSVLPASLLMVAVTATVFWFPRVEVDDGGVRIVNLVRTHYVSWQAIQRIDTRYALTLFTDARKYNAWGAPAPGRHSAFFATKDQGAYLPESTYLAGTVRPGDLISSDSGAAAAVIRRQWEQLRDSPSASIAGASGVATSWHIGKILILIALVVLTALNG